MPRPPTTTAPPPLSTDEYAAIWRELMGRLSEYTALFAELDRRQLSVSADERKRLDELAHLVGRVQQLSGLGGLTLASGLPPTVRKRRPVA